MFGEIISDEQGRSDSEEEFILPNLFYEIHFKTTGIYPKEPQLCSPVLYRYLYYNKVRLLDYAYTRLGKILNQIRGHVFLRFFKLSAFVQQRNSFDIQSRLRFTILNALNEAQVLLYTFAVTNLSYLNDLSNIIK